MTSATQQLINLAESLAADGKEVKVTVLKQRGPRKGETYDRSFKSGAKGIAGKVATDRTDKAFTAGGGSANTFTPCRGIGASMIAGDRVASKRRYDSDAKRLRREAVLHG